MALDLENVGGTSCEPVGGLVSSPYIAPHADFTAINDPADLCGAGAAATVEELVTISADHTFEAGKGFTRINGVEETSSIQTTMIGEKGRRLFQNTLTITVAGSTKKLLGWLRQVKNMKVIVLVEEFGSGQVRQIGSKRLPATFEGIEQAIEAAIEGANSVSLTIQDKSKWPAAVYEGAITEFPVV